MKKIWQYIWFVPLCVSLFISLIMLSIFHLSFTKPVDMLYEALCK
jgi:hypothetical protein